MKRYKIAPETTCESRQDARDRVSALGLYGLSVAGRRCLVWSVEVVEKTKKKAVCARNVSSTGAQVFIYVRVDDTDMTLYLIAP